MKIFFPTCSFYPASLGGPVKTLLWHTEALTERNSEVRILTTNRGLDGKDIALGVYQKEKFGYIKYLPEGSLIRSVKDSIININRSDIIHLNSLFCYLSILNFILTCLFFPRKTIIWSVRGELASSVLNYNKRKKKLVITIYKFFQHRVTFHATSEDEHELINYYFPKSKIVNLPNFIKEPDRIINPEKKCQVIFLGRLHPIKKIENLILAVKGSEVFKEKGFKLFIVGPPDKKGGGYNIELKKLVFDLGLSDEVYFLASVDGKEKEKLLSSSYCLVLPSETENFGNVVIEALNQGTPVIASDKTPWKILEDKGCGFHVSNEIDSLSDALNRMLSLSSSEYDKKCVSAYKLIDNKYSIKEGVNDWLRIYYNEIKYKE